MKSPTGIRGLDEISNGGLPRARPTLVCGGAGCGKTLLGMEFLVHGAQEHAEPGVFVSFEETAEELVANFSSLFDLRSLVARRLLAIEHVLIDRAELEAAGEYDLEGLFVRLGAAIDEVGARRVVLDSIETLFSGLENAGIVRAELKRLFRWLKDRGVTAIVTGERGSGALTRHGLEEYVSDCVVVLDHRVHEQISTRRLRVVKYRGSAHGTNEYPFLIDDQGMSVLPITSLSLEYPVSEERVSSGIRALDRMLAGGGYFRGSTILVSGSAGTGKTSLAAHFADATCRAGERCLYFAYEESVEQLVRNMRSIGVDLRPWIEQGLLRIAAARPTSFGLEMHLVTAHNLVRAHAPSAVVVDPISNLIMAGSRVETRAMLTRLVDFVKTNGMTGLFTSLTGGDHPLDRTEEEISSLIDTWLALRDDLARDGGGRTLTILKSRGMSHAHRPHSFELTSKGIRVTAPVRQRRRAS